MARLGEASLLELFDPILIETLEGMDKLNYDRKSLANLVEVIFGNRCAVENPQIRLNLLKQLKRNEAEELLHVLGLEKPGDPWEILCSAHFRRNSVSYSKLAAWFEVPDILIAQDSDVVPVKKLSLVPNYELFEHQVRAAKEVFNTLTRSGRVILHMPTGSGKTRTAMNVICDHLRIANADDELVIWLAHSEELCQQAAEEFEKAWSHLGNRKVDVIRHFKPFTDQIFEFEGPTFLVISLPSAYSMLMHEKKDSLFFALSRKVGLTIIDEAHKAIAETYKHVLDILAPKGASKLLGLTATPGRSWLDVGEDERLAEFFSREKVTLKMPGYDSPVDFLRDNGYLSEQVNYPIAYEGGQKVKKVDLDNGDFTRAQLDIIGKDTDRNIRILNRTMLEVDEGGQIILFACSTSHAKLITALLVLKNVKVACILGETDTAFRESSITQFKESKLQVLVNYGVLTTGFDAPKADVAIVARPTQSIVLYSQMVGRVMRGPEAGGTKKCKIITVVDQVNGFRDLSESFDFWDDLWE